MTAAARAADAPIGYRKRRSRPEWIARAWRSWRYAPEGRGGAGTLPEWWGPPGLADTLPHRERVGPCPPDNRFWTWPFGLPFGVSRAFQQLLLLGVIGGLSRSTGSVGASGL